MFKTPEQLLGIVMTNPNQIKREQQLVTETLVGLTTSLIEIKKENDSLKYFNFKDTEPDMLFGIDSLDITNENIKEYDDFFLVHKPNLLNIINYLITNKNLLNKTATIGSNSFDMFKSKKNLDDGKEAGVFVGKSDDALSANPSNFYQVDFETKRNLNQHSTDFVSNVLLMNKSKYLHFIISSINLLIDEFKKIDDVENNFDKVDVIMKGGNLLKLLFEKISKDLNSQINDYLQTKFGKNFSASDFDFDLKFLAKNGIDINTYNNTRVLYSNLIIFYITAIRDILFTNKEYFFDFYKFNKKTQEGYVENLINKYNEGIKEIVKTDFVNSLQGQPRKYADLQDAKITSLFYDLDSGNLQSYTVSGENKPTLNFNKTDYNIINDDDSMSRYVTNNNFYLLNFSTYVQRLGLKMDTELKSVQKSITSNNFYYCTSNVNIRFGQTAFSLFRIKVNFIGEIRFANGTKKFIQLPGELLDLSLAKIDDYKSKKSIPEHYSKLLIKNINKEITIQSHTGLINEIVNIIFIETNYKPWADLKYEKRLIRLVILLTLKLLYDHDDTPFKLKIELCEKILDSVKNNFSQDLKLNSLESIIFYKIFAFFYNSYKDTYTKKNTDSDYTMFKNSFVSIFSKMLNVLKLHYNLSLKKGNVHKISYLDGFK